MGVDGIPGESGRRGIPGDVGKNSVYLFNSQSKFYFNIKDPLATPVLMD